VRPDQPELLVYEPEANGELRFVAVEFMIPYAYRARDAEGACPMGGESLDFEIQDLVDTRPFGPLDPPAKA